MINNDQHCLNNYQQTLEPGLAIVKMMKLHARAVLNIPIAPKLSKSRVVGVWMFSESSTSTTKTGTKMSRERFFQNIWHGPGPLQATVWYSCYLLLFCLVPPLFSPVGVGQAVGGVAFPGLGLLSYCFPNVRMTLESSFIKGAAWIILYNRSYI